MNQNIWSLIGFAAVALIVVGGLAFLSQHYTLDNIKSKTVGDGQYGTARWATKREIQKTYRPEYPVVMDMFGVGPTLGPQLIAEIGDVRRFYSKKALVAYAGIDAPPNDSGDVIGRHKSMSKVGASSLRRTLFLVMSVYLQNSPPNEPIYQFMNRKRAEGKPYRVYMMASANKFLRIYYATVKAYLEILEQI